MEGPYRDLGNGFVRLAGAEGARRAPSRISSVEDALLQLLRNARDAGARNVFVASSLRYRRYRALTVIDDGQGIPDAYRDLVFEPGVTTRHLSPLPNPDDPEGPPHGAGLSLYHIKNFAMEAEVLSCATPTAIRVVFDTHTLPERSLQSASRPSRTNLLATVHNFAENNHQESRLTCYYGPPARILATLLHTRIIQDAGLTEELGRRARALGLAVSARTVQRIRRGQIGPVRGITRGDRGELTKREARRGRRDTGAVLALGEEERAEIADILRRAARAGYLELGELRVEARPGEISLRARVYEPEEEYE